jgi:hypothetical protein
MSEGTGIVSNSITSIVFLKTQRPIQRECAAKRAESETDHSPPCSSEDLEYVELYSTTPIRLYGMELR